MGTVDCLTPAFREPIFSDDLLANGIATYNYTMGDMYTTVAYSLTGGNILTWFKEEWGSEEVREAAVRGISPYELLLEQIGARPTDLLVLPYWTPSGTPYFDPQVKGAILGLRMTTTRPDVLRALLEGVAFEMKLNLDILDRSGIAVKELVAIGGGAKNRAFVQLKADVLNRPIARAAVTEAGCMGVAMLARAAHTGADVRDIAADWVRLTDVIEPDPDNAAFYQQRSADYLKLYPTLKSLY
jgi:xylulokinase